MIKFTLRLVLAYLAQELMERINPTERYFTTIHTQIIRGDPDLVVVWQSIPYKRPWRSDGGYILRPPKEKR